MLWLKRSCAFVSVDALDTTDTSISPRPDGRSLVPDQPVSSRLEIHIEEHMSIVNELQETNQD